MNMIDFRKSLFHHGYMFLLLLIAVLPIKEIHIGSKHIKVEIASTFESRKEGLMERKKLEPDSGMLFIFDKPAILSFWMKNTLIPLSVAFFDEKKVLFQVIDMPIDPPGTLFNPIYYSKEDALYALEMPFGWFKKNKIDLGEKFSF